MKLDLDKRLLGEVATLQRGFDLPHRVRVPGVVPVISSSGYAGMHNESRAKGPGVITGRYGTIGKVFYVDQDYWPLNTTLYVKDFHGNDPLFISYLLRTIDFHMHSGKSGVPGVNRNDLHGLEVKVPDVPEQRSIAAALTEIDGLIVSIRQLIFKKRNIMQAVMQQFLTGKRRIPGFSQKWRTAHLEDLIKEIGDGGTPSTTDPRNFGGPVKWVVIDDIKDEIEVTKTNLTEQGLRTCGARLWPAGTLILSTGATIGEVGIAAVPLATKQGICGIIVNSNKASTVFLKFWFVLHRNRLLAIAQGSSIREVRPPTLVQFEIDIPDLPEQNAIAELLSDMGAEITALEQRLAKTNLLKQGMMQNLLTGRIRLV